MRLIDRLYKYIEYKGISAYAFEKSLGLSNGYLGKQYRTGGSVGSEILERIYHAYLDLSLIWLITGEGKMISIRTKGGRGEANLAGEEIADYVQQKDATIVALQQQIASLQELNADKQKIIALLEKQGGKRRGH